VKGRSFSHVFSARFQQILLSTSLPLKQYSRIRLMVHESIIDLKIPDNVPYSGLQVGSALSSIINCDLIVNKLVVIQEEGILLIIAEKHVIMYDIITSLPVGDRLELADKIEKSFYSVFTLIIQLESGTQFWKLNRKNLRWQLRKQEKCLISTVFRINEEEIFMRCVRCDEAKIIQLNNLEKKEVPSTFVLSELARRLETHLNDDIIITELDLQKLQKSETELTALGYFLPNDSRNDQCRVWKSDGYHISLFYCLPQYFYCAEEGGTFLIQDDVPKTVLEMNIDHYEIEIVGLCNQDTYDGFYCNNKKIPVKSLKQISYYDRKRLVIVRTVEQIIICRLDKIIQEIERGEFFDLLFYPLTVVKSGECLVIVWMDAHRQVLRKGLLSQVFEYHCPFTELTGVPAKEDIIDIQEKDGGFSVVYTEKNEVLKVRRKYWPQFTDQPVCQELFELRLNSEGTNLVAAVFDNNALKYDTCVDWLTFLLSKCEEFSKEIVKKAINSFAPSFLYTDLSDKQEFVFSTFPQSVISHSHPKHCLEKFSNIFTFRCSICYRHGSGAAYRCINCHCSPFADFDAHPLCLSPSELFP
jgi:hypothetical protein